MSISENNKKYDVGIVGYWWSTNYGSVATYYALYKIVEGLGLEPVFLDRPQSETAGEGMNVFSRKFLKNYASISERYSPDEYSCYGELCDKYIIGSDQVWTSTSLKSYKYFFFLDFAGKDKKKIAYASSFGETFKVDEQTENKVSEHLKSFSGISVREFQAVDICRKQLGVEAKWVMDPVFLLKKKYWTEISEKAHRKVADVLGSDRKYLLTYILNPSDEKREIVRETAGRLGLPVICILDGRKGTFTENNKNFDMENTLTDVTEEEWLYFFENADYVVTDSQHGSAFSILFNKQFICCSSKVWGQSRFESLFGLLGLKDRQKLTLKDILDAGIINKRIEYRQVNSILNRMVKESYRWLISQLGFDVKTMEENTVYKIKDEDRCSGCGACSQICPKGAIAMGTDENGFLYPEINAGKCVLCGLCLKKCINENPVYENSNEPECYAVMASDEIRMASSSGGMFTLAAKNILDKGGFVCGAAYRNDFSVEHIIINQKEELSKLRGSKYIQSHTDGVYKQIKKLLESGKPVLFSGLPCQIAGLNSFLGKKYDNLYNIELLCHGITSFKVFEKYRKDVLEGKKLTDLQFKSKKPWGWRSGINAEFADGSTYSVPSKSDPYFIAFNKSISSNGACAKCRSNVLPRQGDLMIGDFWGISKKDPEMYDNKGTSIVLVNSEKGARLFEELKPLMKKCKREPLSIALDNNKAIIRPYASHKNRNQFFEYLDRLNFESLATGCLNNRLYHEIKKELLGNISEKDLPFYFVARTAWQKSHGRKIVTWLNSPSFERVLQKYFDLTVAFSVSKSESVIDNKTVFPVSMMKDKSSEYYIVAAEPNYTASLYELMEHYGYKEQEDFIFRKHKPIVLTNLDLSKGNYYDIYGNSIEGFSGVISEVILRGCNNHVTFDENPVNTKNLSLDLSSNANICFGKKCSFNGRLKLLVKRDSGFGVIEINDGCRFGSGVLKIFNSQFQTMLQINDSCTFDDGLEIVASAGKKICIGRDSDFSKYIGIFAGDEHTVFDVCTGRSIDSEYQELFDGEHQLLIGEHVLFAKGAFVMNGTKIGNGSIVGANSVLKGVFPNNCYIAGNPAAVLKRDIAWSREIYSTDIKKCGKKEYYVKTMEE